MTPAGPAHEHFIGIGGIGMSALALHRRRRGIVVTGSDVAANDQTHDLEKKGIAVTIGHASKNLAATVTRVVMTAAIPETNPELAEAKRRGISAALYADVLGETVRGADSVGVAGCHGKTTTTAMLAFLLDHAGRSPNAVVGGVVPHFAGNALLGEGKAFVVEACEYRRSFLSIKPRHAIITNVGADHLDYFKDIEDIRDAFRAYALALPANGKLCLLRPTLEELGLEGKTAARIHAIGDRADDARIIGGAEGFQVRFASGTATPSIRLRVPGEHNVVNAALAAVLAHEAFAIAPDKIAQALSEFRGVGRRFETLFESPEAIVVDDYAHHPDEIRATIAAARGRYPDRRVVAIFQPHLESRTNSLFSPFVEALGTADLALLVADYRVAGRDQVRSDGSERLARAMRLGGASAVYAGEMADAVECALFHHHHGDVMLVMGAGDIREVSLELARRIS